MLLSFVNISNCTLPGRLLQESRTQLCWHLRQWTLGSVTRAAAAQWQVMAELWGDKSHLKGKCFLNKSLRILLLPKKACWQYHLKSCCSQFLSWHMYFLEHSRKQLHCHIPNLFSPELVIYTAASWKFQITEGYAGRYTGLSLLLFKLTFFSVMKGLVNHYETHSWVLASGNPWRHVIPLFGDSGLSVRTK